MAAKIRNKYELQIINNELFFIFATKINLKLTK